MGLLSFIEFYKNYKNKKEGFSFQMSFWSSVIYLWKNIVLFILAIMLARCHNKGDTIHLLGAIFSPTLYVLMMVFQGKICTLKESEVVTKAAIKYLN